MSKQPFHPGKLPKLWDFLAKLHAGSPEVFRIGDLIRSEVEKAWPQLKNPAECPNCGESMQQYAYRVSIIDVQLLNRMVEEVDRRLAGGMSFTQANKIHTPTLATSHTVRNRISLAAKLGLIAKVEGDKGQQVPGTWLITRRGFDALRNKPIPESVFVFRNKIIGRPEGETTFAAVVAAHNEENPAERYDAHDSARWVYVSGIADGKLL